MPPFLWINPRSEPAQMVETVFAVTNTDIDEVFEGLSDAEVGFVIAQTYNKAAEIGVMPVQTDPEAKPYFGQT